MEAQAAEETTKPKTYEDFVVQTFRERAIHSAIIIDDEFPKYHEIGEKELPKAQLDLARELYSSLHAKNIICDIENDYEKASFELIEKVKKSDLVVLDWQLDADRSCRSSTRILDLLVGRDFFNLVVVYTREDLQKAWAQAVAALRFTTQRLKESEDEIRSSLLDEKYDLFTKFDDTLLTDNKIESLFYRFASSGNIAIEEMISTFKENLEKHDIELKKIPRDILFVYIYKWIHNKICKIEAYEKITLSHHDPIIRSANYDIQYPYLATDGAFVVFMKKPLDGVTEGTTNPKNFLEGLDSSLRNWKPGLLQVLLSEFQNTLDRQTYSFSANITNSDDLQVGWIYHLLDKHLGSNDGCPTLEIEDAIKDLLLRMLEGVSNQMLSKMELHGFACSATKALVRELVDGYEQGSTKPKEADLLLAAKSMVYPKEKTDDQDGHKAMLALNAYCCSEDFDGMHITNGTVFFDGQGRYFACTSPACDLAPRTKKVDSKKLVCAIRLTLLTKLEQQKTALQYSTQGQHVFIAVKNQVLTFRTVDSKTFQPELFLFMSDNKLDPSGGTISAHRVLPPHVENDSEPEIDTLTPVASLRASVSDHLLHVVGSHLSRVGMDFVPYGKETSKQQQ